MEFWGVEVKPGETVKCEPEEERLIHISQSALGETKEKGENVPIYVKFNEKKLVLGTLSLEKCAQISHDLVFEKEFELSHGSENASVYFCGYKSDIPSEEYPSDDDIYDFEEDVPVDLDGNNSKVLGGKPKEENAVTKPRGKMSGPTKAEPKVDEDDEDDSEDDSTDDSDGSDGDEDMMEADSDDDEDSGSDGDDESSEDEEEATPEKAAANGKKRPAGSAPKTPAEKKAKLVTPAGQKTGGDGKKGAHVSTPHPAKKEGKTPANSDKGKQQTPKSAGSVNCKSCSKSFHSEKALESHTKAKHSDGK